MSGLAEWASPPSGACWILFGDIEMPRRARPKRETKRECDCPPDLMTHLSDDSAGLQIYYCKKHDAIRKLQKEKYGNDKHRMD